MTTDSLAARLAAATAAARSAGFGSDPEAKLAAAAALSAVVPPDVIGAASLALAVRSGDAQGASRYAARLAVGPYYQRRIGPDRPRFLAGETVSYRRPYTGEWKVGRLAVRPPPFGTCWDRVVVEGETADLTVAQIRHYGDRM